MKHFFDRPGPDEPDEAKDKTPETRNGQRNETDEDFERNYHDIEGGDDGTDLPETDGDAEFFE